MITGAKRPSSYSFPFLTGVSRRAATACALSLAAGKPKQAAARSRARGEAIPLPARASCPPENPFSSFSLTAARKAAIRPLPTFPPLIPCPRLQPTSAARDPSPSTATPAARGRSWPSQAGLARRFSAKTMPKPPSTSLTANTWCLNATRAIPAGKWLGNAITA